MRPQVHPQVHNVLSTFLCEVLLWQPLHDMTMDPDNHLRMQVDACTALWAEDSRALSFCHSCWYVHRVHYQQQEAPCTMP